LDLYAAMPPISDVRTLLGDDAWWAGPPVFGLRPLDVASMPFNQTFSVAENYVHVGMCRSTADTEAASRACEGPLSRVTSVWKLSLGSQN
jgi:hypothetical protein